MTKFEELCQIATEWQDRGFENWRIIWALVPAFSMGFAKYIESPQAYDMDGGRTRPYVKIARHIVKYDTFGERSNQLEEDVDNYFDALEMDTEGYVHFVIAATFERSTAAYPKMCFGVFFRIKNEDSVIDLQMLNRGWVRFPIDAGDRQTWVRIYDAMIDLLKSSLRGRVEDKDGLPSIGFDLSQPPRPADGDSPATAR
jgi:hypothetical protein